MLLFLASVGVNKMDKSDIELSSFRILNFGH